MKPPKIECCNYFDIQPVLLSTMQSIELQKYSVLKCFVNISHKFCSFGISYSTDKLQIKFNVNSTYADERKAHLHDSQLLHGLKMPF